VDDGPRAGRSRRCSSRGRYPTLSRITDQSDVDLDLDTLFEFGLERLLDGYAVVIRASHAQHTS